MSEDKVKKFLDFEVKNKLFDIVDDNGIRVWDLVRFRVGYEVVWEYYPGREGSKKSLISILKKHKTKLLQKLTVLKYLLSRKKYKVVFLITSRYKKGEKYFDQNMDEVLKLYKKDEILVLDSAKTTNTIYKNTINYPQLKKRLSSGNPGFKPYDFREIVELLKREFPYLRLKESSLNAPLKGFYREMNFAKKLFEKHPVEKVFFNQITCKGLIYQAQKKNIPVIEVQHGIIDKNHFVYNYPAGVGVEQKCYVPDKILTLSDFWMKDFYSPIKTQTLGNDYFSSEVPLEPKYENQILVISTNAFGDELSDVTINIAKSLIHWNIYYKLHPNEFASIDKYAQKFSAHKNIELFSNQRTVNDLLADCPVMLTKQSTAIYEALQASRAVVILDTGFFNDLQVDNVYHAENGDDIIKLLSQKLPKQERTIFFDKFNPTIIKELIN